MAINPGSDLLSEALAAAEPQRAKAAAERLAGLSIADKSSVPPFEAALIPNSPEAASPKLPLTPATLLPGTLANQALRSGRFANPQEEFEAAMLKSLFEFMLPEKAASVFGSGFAGEVCRSMFAQSLAQAASHGKAGGIARYLEARKCRAKS